MDLKSAQDQIEKLYPILLLLSEVDLGINPLDIKKLAEISRVRYKDHSNFSNLIFGGIFDSSRNELIKDDKNLFMQDLTDKNYHFFTSSINIFLALCFKLQTFPIMLILENTQNSLAETSIESYTRGQYGSYHSSLIGYYVTASTVTS